MPSLEFRRYHCIDKNKKLHAGRGSVRPVRPFQVGVYPSRVSRHFGI